MPEQFISLLKTLNVPLLSVDDIAKLHDLQKQWKRWDARERQHLPLRVAEDQKTAFDEFLDHPTTENEQRLMVVADTNLLATRYALLRRAFNALRGRVSAQAGEILRPVMQRISTALYAEHERRLETAEPVMSNKNRNPIVIESRKAIEYSDRIWNRVLSACGGHQADAPPLELADVLLTANPTGKLTPETMV